MPTTLPAPLLQQFSAFLSARLGLHFPPPRWADLERGLSAAAADFGLAGPESCIRRLMSAPLRREQVETLASHLTVGETYFFRDPAVFAALEHHILPPLIAAGREQGRRLRLWSAGCCSGEEAYSLAILLDRLIPDLDDWHITLLATDINPHFLARARLGAYREWSFRGTAVSLKPQYFTPAEDGTFTLKPRIRRLVSVDYLNLVDDTYPSLASNTNGMDLILCRNVLMYFAEDTVDAIVAKLRRCLTTDGWLALSPTEGSAALRSGFTAVEFSDTLVYRKTETAERPAPTTAPSWAAAPLPPRPARPAARSAPPARPAAAPPETAIAQARTCFSRGAYAQAADLLSAAAPTAAPDCALAAHACANIGRLDDALRWCALAISADKSGPELRYLQAVILAERGDAAAAIGCFRQALYLDPDFALAHFALGNLHRRLGMATQAARHFDNARRLLANCAADSPLPHAEGLTASRLLAIIDSTEQIS
ncbi:CheR family methyltransferase [Denitromonas iodatirespirans]|uniref:Tetratricopeptide repeat protein n=1 Tax=Denitromonas iodatirespirans TaxID=2795389 RepID=A0A944H6R8_DENI1|nr:CheR family methyltransferase [Denitromonas iodatirespirans]MBT0959560.1 tetratricopeptide repeat protein [Denitromonas iodatirespirans]